MTNGRSNLTALSPAGIVAVAVALTVTTNSLGQAEVGSSATVTSGANLVDAIGVEVVDVLRDDEVDVLRDDEVDVLVEDDVLTLLDVLKLVEDGRDLVDDA